MKKFFVATIAALALSFASVGVFAHDGGNGNHYGNGGGSSAAAGGYIAVEGGYGVTNYSSNVTGTTSSDAAGGGQATSNVNGTGFAAEANMSGDHSSSYTAGQAGAGYATTYTGGDNTAYNVSAGYVSGGGNGNAQGAAGGDYSSKANGAFTTTYTGAQGNAWIAGQIGGYQSYGQYGYGNGGE